MTSDQLDLKDKFSPIKKNTKKYNILAKFSATAPLSYLKSFKLTILKEISVMSLIDEPYKNNKKALVLETITYSTLTHLLTRTHCWCSFDLYSGCTTYYTIATAHLPCLLWLPVISTFTQYSTLPVPRPQEYTLTYFPIQ